MTLSPGTRLGPYEIVAPLGAGGMGEVYRAKDSRLGRDVAIKVLSSNLSSSPELRQRFELEARTISQLSHPHICALYDVGREGETDFLVMEYLEGETLADRLARRPLPLDQTLRHGTEIADTLDKAHRQGIVHRDLKPGNVMLTKSGVKLLDFGLAKTLERSLDATGREQAAAAQHPMAGVNLTAIPTVMGSPSLTQEGTILGTFQYMAPEQLEGKEADARTDLFALGCVLYEMVTGRKAFAATSQASLIGAILHKDPESISKLEPLTPPALDRLIRRCLAKDPEHRWQSARDVALELADVTRPEGAPARRPRTALLSWAVAAALLLALGWILAGPRRNRSAPATAKLRFTVPPPPGSSLLGMLALSPAGETLAFVATGADGRDRLWVRPLDSLESRALEGTEGAEFPFWSPDGRSIAFSGAALSPDGRWMAYLSDESEADEIYVQSFPAGNDRQQVSVGGGTQARWRGDGRELFYMSPDRKVMAVDIPAGERIEAGKPHALFQTRILPLVEARNHYDVTADGQRFVVNSRRPEDAALPITIVGGWTPEPKK